MPENSEIFLAGPHFRILRTMPVAANGMKWAVDSTPGHVFPADRLQQAHVGNRGTVRWEDVPVVLCTEGVDPHV
jgi:hypothetical protein